MSDYATNTTWDEIAQRVAAAGRLALVSHRRPDGDAMGSMLALGRALTRRGKRADIFTMGPIEAPLLEIAAATPLRRVETDPPGDDFDLVVVVDTGAWTQLEPVGDWLRGRHERIVGLDHHGDGDDVAALRIVDTSAAAAVLLVLRLLDELGWPPEDEPDPGAEGGIAEALFVGLATDTGWFRFSNAGAEAYRAAARLLALGVDKSRLFRLTEETFRPERLALEARALRSVEFHRQGTVAIQSLGLDDFRETGGGVEDLTSLVNRPMIVGRVQVGILLAETEPGVTKVSLRSKPAQNGDAAPAPDTDVAALAGRLGGGGHVFAAGARIPQGLAGARAAVLAALGSLPPRPRG